MHTNDITIQETDVKHIVKNNIGPSLVYMNTVLLADQLYPQPF